MRYSVIRTDVADSQIRSIILYIAEKFGNNVALRKLGDLEKGILALADNPDLGTEPRYLVLRRQGYRVLVLEKNLVFYKVSESQKEIIIYAVVDQRQDYISIIRGL
ncbi:MAG TPA: type II toxin-antitoxin system RelE/ParE family toxin [Lachnospiraceae bacterium]|nr:type II toxin-antitoxin system RelE/ParE family toxin [Lachnospiraceae bacterium]